MTGVPIKRKPEPLDVVDVIDQSAQSLRDFYLLRLKSDFPEWAKAHADELESSADQYAADVRMVLANAILQVNPAERKRAKKRAR